MRSRLTPCETFAFNVSHRKTGDPVEIGTRADALELTSIRVFQLMGGEQESAIEASGPPSNSGSRLRHLKTSHRLVVAFSTNESESEACFLVWIVWERVVRDSTSTRPEDEVADAHALASRFKTPKVFVGGSLVFTLQLAMWHFFWRTHNTRPVFRSVFLKRLVISLHLRLTICIRGTKKVSDNRTHGGTWRNQKAARQEIATIVETARAKENTGTGHGKLQECQG